MNQLVRVFGQALTVAWLLTVAPHHSNFAAEDGSEVVPEDTCILDLILPPRATVTIDGQDRGTKREFKYEHLRPGKSQQFRLEVCFPGGGQVGRTVFLYGPRTDIRPSLERADIEIDQTLFLHAGQRVRLVLQDPGARKPELFLQMGHRNGITSTAFSPNGQLVLTGSRDGTAILWDAATAVKLRTFLPSDASWRQTPAEVRCVGFSPDGRQVLTASEGNDVVLWETGTGKRVRWFSGKRGQFSPDGRTVLVGGVAGAYLADAATGDELKSFAEGKDVSSVAFRSDGRQVLTGSWQTATLWDASSGQKLRTFAGHTQDVCAVAFRPDGRQVLTASEHGKAILWDASSGQELRTFATGFGGHSSVAFSPNGRQVLTTFDGDTANYGATLWDAASGRKLRTFAGSATAVSFSPDGRHVLTGSTDGAATLWDAAAGSNLRIFQGQAPWPILSMSLGADGRHLITGSEDRMAVLWDMTQGTKRQAFAHPFMVYAVAVSPDGQRVFTAYKSAEAVEWDAANGVQPQRLLDHVDLVTSVATCADERCVLTGCVDKSAVLWDTATGVKTRTFQGHTAAVVSAALSTDGRRVLTVSQNGPAILWDAITGKRLAAFQGQDDRSVDDGALSPDGSQVLTAESVDAGSLMTVWDAATGARRRSLEGPRISKGGLAFSPDGGRILTTSDGKAAALWDAASLALLQIFAVRESRFSGIAFSPDGQKAVIAAGDGTVRIWDAATGQELACLLSLDSGGLFDAPEVRLARQEWLVVTPEGLFDGSPGGRQKVSYRIGGGLQIVPVDRFFQDFYQPGLLAEIWRGRRPVPSLEFGKTQPPIVQIVSPQSGDVETQEVTLEVEATDQGGGISALTLYQNGARVLAPGEKRQEGKTLHRTFRGTLVEGENRLRVTSATDDGSWESEPAEIVLRYAKPLAKSRLHLVAVGINQYADANLNLSFAAKDAQALAELFQRRGKGLYEEVHLTELLDSQATKAGIQEALKQVAIQTRPQDTLVLFLAGHGTMIGQRYYFIPHELRKQAERLEDDIRRQGLPADELSDYLGSAAALKRILILDTCASGGALGVVLKGRSGFELRGAIERLSRTQGIFTIAASAASEQAQEAKELGHGVLSYALLAGLKGVDSGPLADKHVQPSGPERVVDVMDWFSFASGQVPRLTEEYYGVSQDVQTSTQGASFPVLPLEE